MECTLKSKLVLQDLIEKAEQQPNLTVGIIVSIAVIIFTVFIKLLFGGKKPVSVEGPLEELKKYSLLLLLNVALSLCCAGNS